MNSRPQIVIADDHTLIAEACRQVLETEYDVVATVADGRELVRVVAALRPTLVIIDINMPLLNGLDAGRKIKRLLPSVKLVYLTVSEDPDLAAEAFRSGACAYLLKTRTISELSAAVKEVLKGNFYLSPAIAKDTVQFLVERENQHFTLHDQLTERQREVLQLLTEGKSMKEVGSILNLTTRTVAFHKYRIMQILNTHSNAELVRYAMKRHILSG